MANLNGALEFLSLPNACPLCIVALDPRTGRPIAVNSTFESVLGPFYKFEGWEFADAACEDDANAIAAAAAEEAEKDAAAAAAAEGKDDAKEEEEEEEENKGHHETRNRTRFRKAVDRVRDSLRAEEDAKDDDDDAGDAVMSDESERSGKIRNVQMLALGANDAGLPVRKYFDWTIGSVRLDDDAKSEGDADDDGDDGPASAVILYGDMINEAESSNRARDAELVDFLDNAPIAMHWLNGNGIVLWANQTELNVLGYSPEEYIGQPIMNFCPDEQELVLEIFKQLGSGNAIADVPVRFRTKDGKLVHLLIDSNVAYNPDGSFGHTRCFIRDDTARKIRDARTKLLLEENERSLRMLDSFLSRTLHHVMGPLHALRGTCEVVSDRLQLKRGGGGGGGSNNIDDDDDEREKNCELLERAADTVTTTTRMVADVSDLARFDEGATLRTKLREVDLRALGSEAIEKLRFDALRLTGGDDGIAVSVEFVGGGGPRAAATDGAALLRVLAHLLENAVREVDKGGKVTLRVTSQSRSSSSDDGAKNSVLVEVLDDGRGLPSGTCLDQGGFVDGNVDSRPPPCHRYLIGSANRSGGGGAASASNDPDELQKVRAEMEEGLRDLKQNGVGVGLPLSYHLVRVLGGDLRHERLASRGTRIWFVLPNPYDGPGRMTDETLFKKGLPPAQITFDAKDDAAKEKDRGERQPSQKNAGNKRRRVDGTAEFGNFVSSDGSTTTTGDDTTASPNSGGAAAAPPAVLAADPAPVAVAKCGVKASMPFSVLIVEDTDICARLLAMQLKRMKCSTQRAENGQVAVNLLKESMPGTFDMVLMDLRMPVMDGLEATKLIRNELRINDLPILALTGEMREDIRSECEGIGFTEFFQKPLPKKKLQDLVAKYKAARDGSS